MTACLVLRRPHDCPWCICLCLIFCHFLPISSPICSFMSFLFLKLGVELTGVFCLVLPNNEAAGLSHNTHICFFFFFKNIRPLSLAVRYQYGFLECPCP